MIRFAETLQHVTGWLRRRDLLQIGGRAALGMGSAAAVTPVRTAASESPSGTAPGFGKAKSVIIVFASGGQSQLDTWDPKPEAPVEIRGAFDSIASSVPGVRFCEHMPKIAQIADRLCIVRNMAHEDLDHGSAFYLANTGRYHRRRSGNPLPSPDDYPCFGSVLQRVRPSSDFVQTAVHLNGPAEVPKIVAPGQFGGFLGRGFDPLTLGDVTLGNTPIPSLLPQDDVSGRRMQARQSLLQSVEAGGATVGAGRLAQEKQALYAQAFEMLERRETQDAFNLAAEPDTLRHRYGMNRSGQACLLARRLVEAGVPLVNVIWSHNNRGQDIDPSDPDLYGWDTHNDIFDALQHQLLPRFDQGFSALIEDLDNRGLLDETLVVCMGEFGRAPLVALEKRFAGSSPGRKHWSWVYSVAVAGAGVGRGTVVGASDSRGAYPTTEPYGPWDMMATVFSALGINPHAEYTDTLNRPFRVCEGNVMESVYA
ncbi:MAG: DUF1501 domain-containing protein [Fuerstiella sp.]